MSVFEAFLRAVFVLTGKIMCVVGDLIFASSEKSSDIFYATGFRAPDPFLYYAAEGKKAVVVSRLERDRAVSEVNDGIRVYDLTEFVGAPSDVTVGWKDAFLALVERFPASRWRVPTDFPLSQARLLESAGLSLDCVDGAFFPERQKKSDDEIVKIIQGQRLAEKGMARAAALLASAEIADDGTLLVAGGALTSESLRFEIDVEILRGGGLAVDTIVSCGAQAAEPHNLGNGPLRAGETIVIDIFPKGSDGYHGDLTRTFVVGTPSDAAAAAYEAVREARDKAKTLLKAGSIPSEVHKTADAILRERGFETTNSDGVNRGFFHGLGHGLGLDIHEAPRLNPRNSQPLESGEVVTVEPGLYYPEWGGVRLEDVVVIRENGCETLTNCPTEIDPKLFME